MLRKISTLTFLLTLIMGLAACGAGGSEPAADAGAGAGGAEETPATDPTAPPVDETPTGTVEPDGGPEVLPPAPDGYSWSHEIDTAEPNGLRRVIKGESIVVASQSVSALVRVATDAEH